MPRSRPTRSAPGIAEPSQPASTSASRSARTAAAVPRRSTANERARNGTAAASMRSAYERSRRGADLGVGIPRRSSDREAARADRRPGLPGRPGTPCGSECHQWVHEIEVTAANVKNGHWRERRQSRGQRLYGRSRLPRTMGRGDSLSRQWQLMAIFEERRAVDVPRQRASWGRASGRVPGSLRARAIWRADLPGKRGARSRWRVMEGFAVGSTSRSRGPRCCADRRARTPLRRERFHVPRVGDLRAGQGEGALPPSSCAAPTRSRTA